MFVSRKIGFDTAKGEPSSLGGGTSGPVRRQGAAHTRACLRHAAADRAQDLYALRVAAHDDVESARDRFFKQAFSYFKQAFSYQI